MTPPSGGGCDGEDEEEGDRGWGLGALSIASGGLARVLLEACRKVTEDAVF